MDNAQELIQRLNHSGKKLSKSHRRIAECIVTHYDKVVFMTASKLGEYVGVSESTVVRFAAALGYSGYPQLQKALQELLRHRLTASQRFELTNDMDHVQVLKRDNGESKNIVLIDKKNMTEVQCYKKANVSKKTFWKINNDPNYKPSKQTVIAFAIALELTLAETKDLLRTVGFTLSHSNTFDMII